MAFGACKHKVSGSFHSPPGVLFTFPSRYCFTIGHQLVFRLGWWSTLLPTAIPRVPWYSGFGRPASNFAYVALTPCGGPSQTLRLSSAVTSAVLYPARISTRGLAFCAFARHYLRNLV